MDIRIKSDQELLFELRNKVAGRIIENKANMKYWSWVVIHSKKNSQEIVDAQNSVELNKDNVKKDSIFLQLIDLMIRRNK